MAKLEGFDRIIGMDLSKRTFKACVLTRGKNFEDRKIFCWRSPILTKKRSPKSTN